MSVRTGFERDRIKSGMVVRIDCENDQGQTWSSEGVVADNGRFSGYICFRDDPDGVYDWEVVQHVELLALLPPEEYEDE